MSKIAKQPARESLRSPTPPTEPPSDPRTNKSKARVARAWRAVRRHGSLPTAEGPRCRRYGAVRRPRRSTNGSQNRHPNRGGLQSPRQGSGVGSVQLGQKYSEDMQLSIVLGPAPKLAQFARPFGFAQGTRKNIRGLGDSPILI